MKPVKTVLLTLLLAIPGVAGAEYYYEYETDVGTLSFTDDLRRVPEKYRKVAERHLSRPLFEYDRATIIEKGAATASADTIFGDQLLSGVRPDGFDWSFASRRAAAAQKLPYYDMEIEDRVYFPAVHGFRPTAGVPSNNWKPDNGSGCGRRK